MPLDGLNEFGNDIGILWGAAAIGKQLGLTRRQAYHLLSAGKLKGAVKIGNRWAITTKALLSNFETDGGDGSAPIGQLSLGRSQHNA